MHYHWSDFVRETIHGKYVLGNFLGERRGAGLYEVSLGPEAVPALLHLLPAGEGSWSLAADLTHPNLVRVLDTGSAELDGIEFVFAVTELPEETVAEVLPQRALTEDEGRQILSGILPALRYLHEKGLVHGAIEPGNIVAVGDTVKLTVDSVSRTDERSAFSGDIRSLGATLVQMLTGKRSEDTATLSPRFQAIAEGMMDRDPQRQWGVDRVERALSGPARSWNWKVPAVAAAVAILLISAVFFFRRSPEQPAARVTRAEYRPSPVTSERARVETPKSPVSPPPVAAIQKPASQWAVVAAIYRDYDAAEKRARSMEQRWSGSKVQVFPGRGEGRRYLVTLGLGLTKRAADQLRSKAVSAGLPGDTYVTRLTTPEVVASR